LSLYTTFGFCLKSACFSEDDSRLGLVPHRYLEEEPLWIADARFFTMLDELPILSPNQQCQSTERIVCLYNKVKKAVGIDCTNSCMLNLNTTGNFSKYFYGVPACILLWQICLSVTLWYYI